MLARLLGSCLLATTLLTACGGSSPPADRPESPQRVCTLLFVHEGLDIEVAGTWTDAPITVEIVASGQALTVEAHGSAQGAHCGAGSSNQDLGCGARNDRFEVVVAPAMASDEPARVRVSNVGAVGGPEELTITVRHGALTATRTLRPTYAKHEPNGPGCGEVVKARETLTLGG